MTSLNHDISSSIIEQGRAAASNEEKYIDSIDLLRGFAAVMVCIFHLSGSGVLFEPGFVRDFLAHGAIGVPIFFVITGFVIPFSLANGKYTVRKFGTFLLKRLIRLEPPYIISIIVSIFFWVAFKFHAGKPLKLSLENIIFHFGYMVDVAKSVGRDVDWFAPVYWTLQYELQFYVLVAIAFPLIGSSQFILRGFFFVVFLGLQVAQIGLGNTGSFPLVYGFADLFLMGVVIFQRKSNIIRNFEFGSLFMILLISIGLRYESFYFYGPVIFALIMFFNLKIKVADFLGKISYSMYLYHEVFGLWLVGAFITVAKFDKITSFGLSFFAVIIFSYIMFALIERPFMRMAKKITYS